MHVLQRDKSYLTYKSDSNKIVSKTDIIKTLDFLIESIFVTFVRDFFQQKNYISTETSACQLV